MLYTGRCERLEDIFICGQFKKAGLRCSGVALEESNNLLAKFKSNMEEIESFNQTHWRVSYVNVRSLKAHLTDVLNSQRLIQSDLLGLGETWLEEKENINIDGFNGYFANAGRGKGVSGFSKIELEHPPKTIATEKHSLVMLQTKHFDIVFLYLSKGFDSNCIVNILKNWIDKSRPSAVMGDVNLNYSESNKFRNFMEEEMMFKQLITHPTHESGSLIDHLYVNKKMMEIKVVHKTYEKKEDETIEKMVELNVVHRTFANYFTDHDTITLCVPKGK